VVIQMCYVGPKENGQEHLAAISVWDGEQCLLNEVDEKSFLHQQDRCYAQRVQLFAPVLKFCTCL
jgi:hypothetical protein